MVLCWIDGGWFGSEMEGCVESGDDGGSFGFS